MNGHNVAHELLACQKMFDPQSYVAKWKEMGAMASVVLSSSDSPDVDFNDQLRLQELNPINKTPHILCHDSTFDELYALAVVNVIEPCTPEHRGPRQFLGRSSSLPAQNPNGPTYSTAPHKEPRPEIRAPPFCQRHHSSAIKLTASQSPTHFWAAASDLEPTDPQTSPRGRGRALKLKAAQIKKSVRRPYKYTQSYHCNKINRRVEFARVSLHYSSRAEMSHTLMSRSCPTVSSRCRASSRDMNTTLCLASWNTAIGVWLWNKTKKHHS
uniref:Uncharacterized protein n=1 Tax=Timema tahoe TaxID=61484 RepID=A0A7R9NXT1_9NEOP|nr:unnamed protein product [Timema tahoe]